MGTGQETASSTASPPPAQYPTRASPIRSESINFTTTTGLLYNYSSLCSVNHFRSYILMPLNLCEIKCRCWTWQFQSWWRGNVERSWRKCCPFNCDQAVGLLSCRKRPKDTLLQPSVMEYISLIKRHALISIYWPDCAVHEEIWMEWHLHTEKQHFWLQVHLLW